MPSDYLGFPGYGRQPQRNRQILKKVNFGHSRLSAVRPEAVTSHWKEQACMKIEEIEQLLITSEAYRSNQSAKLLEHAISIYESKRVDNTVIDNDGDMLLFQWGTYDWGQERFFEVDLTRQIILDLDDPDDAADSMQQLKIVLKYATHAETDAIESGNMWCHSPIETNEFSVLVKSSNAFGWIQRKEPINLKVSLGRV